MTALAVDPDDAQRVLATSGTALLASVDGGITFVPDPEQPPRPLNLVDHAGRTGGGGDTVLAGADRGRAVWTLARGALVLEGSVAAPPQAFTIIGPGRYVIATAQGVLASEDAGRTWELVAPMS
ncbi:hypothetical protein [Pseudonocardia sp. GCM10023141]|uniref:hypothetical protein n=1 Tax=Pseudonocardia sp. GCM10023141 TaxID=3252653 RepID=UPI0036083845